MADYTNADLTSLSSDRGSFTNDESLYQAIRQQMDQQQAPPPTTPAAQHFQRSMPSVVANPAPKGLQPYLQDMADQLPDKPAGDDIHLTPPATPGMTRNQMMGILLGGASAYQNYQRWQQQQTMGPVMADFTPKFQGAVRAGNYDVAQRLVAELAPYAETTPGMFQLYQQAGTFLAQRQGEQLQKQAMIKTLVNSGGIDDSSNQNAPVMRYLAQAYVDKTLNLEQFWKGFQEVSPQVAQNAWGMLYYNKNRPGQEQQVPLPQMSTIGDLTDAQKQANEIMGVPNQVYVDALNQAYGQRPNPVALDYLRQHMARSIQMGGGTPLPGSLDLLNKFSPETLAKMGLTPQQLLSSGLYNMGGGTPGQPSLGGPPATPTPGAPGGTSPATTPGNPGPGVVPQPGAQAGLTAAQQIQQNMMTFAAQQEAAQVQARELAERQYKPSQQGEFLRMDPQGQIQRATQLTYNEATGLAPDPRYQTANPWMRVTERNAQTAQFVDAYEQFSGLADMLKGFIRNGGMPFDKASSAGTRLLQQLAEGLSRGVTIPKSQFLPIPEVLFGGGGGILTPDGQSYWNAIATSAAQLMDTIQGNHDNVQVAEMKRTLTSIFANPRDALQTLEGYQAQMRARVTRMLRTNGAVIENPPNGPALETTPGPSTPLPPNPQEAAALVGQQAQQLLQARQQQQAQPSGFTQMMQNLGTLLRQGAREVGSLPGRATDELRQQFGAGNREDWQ